MLILRLNRSNTQSVFRSRRNRKQGLMKFAITSLTLALLLTFVSNAEGKAWHAIVPLQSTRADVVKALGEGIDSKNPGARFNLQTEDVYIAYSCKEPYGDECLRLLPPDLVLQIQVIPKLKFTLDSLGLKEKTLKTLAFSPEKPLRSQGFIDDDEGIVVSLNGTVEQIVYVPTRSDRARCAGYYRDLTVFVKTIVCILCPTIAVVSPNSAEVGTQINFYVV